MLIESLIFQISEGNEAEATEIFKEIMLDKISVKLEKMKSDVMESLFQNKLDSEN